MTKTQAKCGILVGILFALGATSAPAQQSKPKPPKSVRLYVIDCGTLDNPDTSAYRFKMEELAQYKMSAPCFLVVHPKGTLMWDTGPVPDSNFKPGIPYLAFSHSWQPLCRRCLRRLTATFSARHAENISTGAEIARYKLRIQRCAVPSWRSTDSLHKHYCPASGVAVAKSPGGKDENTG